jgi:hypothetical protein
MAITPWQESEALMGVPQARHGAWHPNCQVSEHGRVGEIPRRVEVHIPGCGRRRALTIVDCGCLTVGEPDHHEATTTDVAGLGTDNGQGK